MVPLDILLMHLFEPSKVSMGVMRRQMDASRSPGHIDASYSRRHRVVNSGGLSLVFLPFL